MCMGGGGGDWYSVSCGGLDTGSEFLNKIGHAMKKHIMKCVWLGGGMGGMVWIVAQSSSKMGSIGHCRGKGIKCVCCVWVCVCRGEDVGTPWVAEALILALSSSTKLDRPLKRHMMKCGWVGGMGSMVWIVAQSSSKMGPTIVEAKL